MLDSSGNRRADRHEHTRADILEAAWDLARVKGLAGITLRDLAAAVGMRAPSLYSYFASKYAIYDAMFAQGMSALADRLAALMFTEDPVERLHEGARVFVAFCVEDPARYQLLFQRTIPDFEPSPGSYGLSVALLEQTRTTLDAVGAADCLDLYTGITGGLAAQQNANEPGGDRWVNLVNQAVEMFLAHVRTRGKRKR